MTPALVSCIVPVWNGERFVAEALDSILAQTYRSLELIVVDDGSTDGTAARVKAYGSRVACVRQPNAGPAAARNTGIRLAGGEFVAFLDADDIWHPEKLTRQLRRFEARAELDFCVAHAQNFSAPELGGAPDASLRVPRAGALPGYVTSTLLARRALIERIGVFDPTLRHGDDTDWFLRAIDGGAVREVLPDVLLFRRLHRESLSHRNASKSHDEYVLILRARIARHRRLARSAATGPPGESAPPEA